MLRSPSLKPQAATSPSFTITQPTSPAPRIARLRIAWSSAMRMNFSSISESVIFRTHYRQLTTEGSALAGTCSRVTEHGCERTVSEERGTILAASTTSVHSIFRTVLVLKPKALRSAPVNSTFPSLCLEHPDLKRSVGALRAELAIQRRSLKCLILTEIRDCDAQRVRLNQLVRNGIAKEKNEVRGIELSLDLDIFRWRIGDLIEMNGGLIRS